MMKNKPTLYFIHLDEATKHLLEQQKAQVAFDRVYVKVNNPAKNGVGSWALTYVFLGNSFLEMVTTPGPVILVSKIGWEDRQARELKATVRFVLPANALVDKGAVSEKYNLVEVRHQDIRPRL